MSKPSILHIKNLAGVGTQLRDAQRRLGYESDLLVFDSDGWGHSKDYHLPNTRVDSVPVPLVGEGLQVVENVLRARQIFRQYDILHFHAYTVVGADVAPRRPPQGLDLPLWKRAGKTVIMHHHGTDIRDRGCPPLQRRYADLRLVSTPDLLDDDPGARYVPNPINTTQFEYVGVDEPAPDEPATVVHAPTDRKKKGTQHVIDAVDRLQRDGVDVELRIVEDTPNDEALEIYKQADIIADRFKLGWYGVFSLEAMALGKPVLVYMDDDLAPYDRGAPVVDTSIDGLADNIRSLATDVERRKELGRRGREFVETHHDATTIAMEILDHAHPSDSGVGAVRGADASPQ